MGTFSNVDVSSLRNAIRNCRNSLDKSKSLDVINTISDDNVWSDNIRDQVKKNLENMTSNYYEKVVEYLNKLDEMASYIDQYQQAEKERDYLQNNRLYKEVTHYYGDYSYTTTEIDQSVVYQIQNLQNRMNMYLNRIRSIG